MALWVLDASALLAFLNVEPGCERVETILLEEDAVASSVNLAEVLSKLAEWGVPTELLLARLDATRLRTVDYDRAQAQTTAGLRVPTKALGLSLGDRACLALAKQLNATALTADRPWTRLDPALDIAIACIRE